jgi:hypothetical protein
MTCVDDEIRSGHLKVEIEKLFPKRIQDGLEIVQLARLKKEAIATTDNSPPLARHSWIRIPAGSLVGLIETVDVLNRHERVWGPHASVYLYLTDGTHYHLVRQPLSNLDLIEEEK